jgi:hypothetical protein
MHNGEIAATGKPEMIPNHGWFAERTLRFPITEQRSARRKSARAGGKAAPARAP